MELISQPWHWSLSGVMIVLTMYLLIMNGKRFGVSSSFKTLCRIGGAGKTTDYFKFDWKEHDWLLLFVLGAIIGGAISQYIIPDLNPIKLSAATVADLKAMGIDIGLGHKLVPDAIFHPENMVYPKNLFILIVGGLLIGFGTRYAGGCTSGHAISGLSNLQLPSLVAVIGFFIGGLLMTHFIFPLIMNF